MTTFIQVRPKSTTIHVLAKTDVVHQHEQENEQKPLSLRAELIENFKKFSEMTTSHGLPHLLEARSWYIRVMWLVFMVCSFSLCGYMVFYSLTEYLSYGVKTQLRIENLKEIEFPVVSFCNLNSLITPEANEYVQDYYRTKYNTTLEDYKELLSGIYNGNYTDETGWLIYQTYDEEFKSRQSFGYSVESMFTKCEFNKEPCNADDFEWYYSPFYSNCFKFNSGKNSNGTKVPKKYVNKEGNGLYVEMFTGLPDDYYSFMYESFLGGMAILIDDPSSFPIRKDGVLLTPGVHASIILNKIESKTLSEPYSSCKDADSIDTVISNEMKRIGYPYNRRNCIVLCEQKQTIDKIGCYSMYLPAMFDAQPCRTYEQFTNLGYVYVNYSLCDQYCPVECTYKSFEKTLSYSKYPSYNYYLEKITYDDDFYTNIYSRNDIFYDVMHKSTAAVYIYFEDLKVIKQSEMPSMTLVDLVASIGGVLGLFVGVSVLTAAEIVELILESSYAILKRIFRKFSYQKP